MIIYKCDYCGKEIEAEKVGEIYEVSESASMFKPLDEYNDTLICRSCLEKLKQKGAENDASRKKS